MFENPGRKIKTLATVLTVIMIVASFVLGFMQADIDVGLGVAILIGGILIAFISGLFLYAMGSLVEDTQEIRATLRRLEKKKGGAARESIEDEPPERPRAEKRRAVYEPEPADEGKTWQCECGAVNPFRIKTCSCGRSLYEVVAGRLGQQDE